MDEFEDRVDDSLAVLRAKVEQQLGHGPSSATRDSAATRVCWSGSGNRPLSCKRFKAMTVLTERDHHDDADARLRERYNALKEMRETQPEREAARMGVEGFVLGQGTIYPDTIESGGAKHAKVIKTHHNRVPLVEQMIAEGRVSEPLKDLYKTVWEIKQKVVIDQAAERGPFICQSQSLNIHMADATGTYLLCYLL